MPIKESKSNSCTSALLSDQCSNLRFLIALLFGGLCLLWDLVKHTAFSLNGAAVTVAKSRCLLHCLMFVVLQVSFTFYELFGKSEQPFCCYPSEYKVFHHQCKQWLVEPSPNY